MKVRILSGNARGQILEMGQTEAEANISTGYAQIVDEAGEKAQVEALEKAEDRSASRSKRGR